MRRARGGPNRRSPRTIAVEPPPPPIDNEHIRKHPTHRHDMRHSSECKSPIRRFSGDRSAGRRWRRPPAGPPLPASAAAPTPAATPSSPSRTCLFGHYCDYRETRNEPSRDRAPARPLAVAPRLGRRAGQLDLASARPGRSPAAPRRRTSPLSPGRSRPAVGERGSAGESFSGRAGDGLGPRARWRAPVTAPIVWLHPVGAAFHVPEPEQPSP